MIGIRDLRSLRAKFLAITLPLILLMAMLIFGLFEYLAYRQASESLADRLVKLATVQAQVLALPLWGQDMDQASLQLAALALEPDVSGAAIRNKIGESIASVGAAERTDDPNLRAERDIVHEHKGERLMLGRLIVVMSDRRVRDELAQRAIRDAGLLCLLLLVVMVSVLLANRRTIGIPLERLLESIESGDTDKQVDWQVDDEMGRVVGAFNDMQRRRRRHEDTLRDVTLQLEQRVEERTARLQDALVDIVEREKQLLSIVDKTSLAVAVIEARSIVYTNHRFNEMFLETEDQVINKIADEFLVDSGVSATINEHLRKDNAIRDQEAQMRRGDGSSFWVRMSIYPFEYQGRMAWLMSCYEITQRIVAERALRESDQLLRLVSDNVPAVLAYVDSDYRFKFANRHAAEYFDRPLNKIIGHTVREVVREDEYERAMLRLGESLDGKPQRFDLQRAAFDSNSKRWIDATHVPDTDDSGAVRGIYAFLQDVTERKQVEQALEQKTALLEVTLENIDQGIFMVDSGLQVVAYNQRMVELVGLPDEFLRQRPTSEQILRYQAAHGEFPEIGDDPEPVVAKWMDKLHQAKDFHRYQRQRPNGTILECRNKRLPDGGWVRTFTDITEGAQAAQAVERAMEAAQAASRAKSAFVANMSHEIRTPLNAIIGLTDLTLRTKLDNKQRDYLSKAKGASESLFRIINDILDYSKIEAGKLHFEAAEFDLDQVFERLETMVGMAASTKGLELVYSIDENVPIGLVGDPLRLEQVLVNLVGNAVKFTSDGEVVISVCIVSSSSDQIVLRFSVRDTGVGFTREQHSRLFQPFTQADDSTTRQYGGTGLGLVICKRLVEQMGGEISLQSVYGQGTTVTFSGQFRLSEEAVTPIRNLPPDLRGARAMVIDDSRSSREILRRALSALSFEVATADSAEQAIDALCAAAQRGEPYTLVLLDWKMPEVDGLEAIRRIKSEPRLESLSLTVIMVTAYEKDALLAQAGDLQLDGVLTKPVSPSTLFNTVIDVLGASSELVPAYTYGDANAQDLLVRLDGLRVLLVEDNLLNQAVAKGILEHAGIDVQVADNGREGVERIAIHGPDYFDAVLMDLQMPRMDGYAATQALREAHGTALPIIAMTAHVAPEERERCLQAGMNDHVPKPIDPNRLMETLVKWTRPTTAIIEASRSIPDIVVPATIRAQLPVPGLNVEDGLQRLMGNWALYRELLSTFEASAVETAAQFDLARANGDRLEAARLVHRIRGLAGNLSADTLSAVAAELERALTTGSDDRGPEALASRFHSAVEQVSRSIASLHLDVDGGDGPQLDPALSTDRAPPSAELQRELNELNALLEARDLSAGKRFARLSQRYDFSGAESEAAALNDHLERLDYTKARAVVDQLARALESH